MTKELDIKILRNCFGKFATGITVITALAPDGTKIGLTVNSFSSLSLEPPLVLWSLDKKSKSLSAFIAATHFAINVLASDQMDISNNFARTSEDKFNNIKLSESKYDLPLLSGTVAHLECKNISTYEGGDHLIFIGEVEHFKTSNKKPLLYTNGQYTIAGVDQKNKIIFSFLVNSEIDQQKCISSLQKVMNEEARRVLMTHRSILLRTNEIYDEFNKQRISEEQNKKKILEELKQNKSQLIPLLSVEKTFGRLDYSVNERVLNTLKIQLLSDTINRKNLFLTTKVTLVSKKQSSTKEVFFIVMIAMFSIMNLKLFIKVIRKF